MQSKIIKKNREISDKLKINLDIQERRIQVAKQALAMAKKRIENGKAMLVQNKKTIKVCQKKKKKKPNTCLL